MTISSASWLDPLIRDAPSFRTLDFREPDVEELGFLAREHYGVRRADWDLVSITTTSSGLIPLAKRLFSRLSFLSRTSLLILPGRSFFTIFLALIA